VSKEQHCHEQRCNAVSGREKRRELTARDQLRIAQRAADVVGLARRHPQRFAIGEAR